MALHGSKALPLRGISETGASLPCRSLSWSDVHSEATIHWAPHGLRIAIRKPLFLNALDNYQAQKSVQFVALIVVKYQD